MSFIDLENFDEEITRRCSALFLIAVIVQTCNCSIKVQTLIARSDLREKFNKNIMNIRKLCKQIYFNPLKFDMGWNSQTNVILSDNVLIRDEPKLFAE